jgi:hypothetical protein
MNGGSQSMAAAETSRQGLRPVAFFWLALIAALAVLVGGAGQARAAFPPGPEWDQILNEEFSGSSLNTTLWSNSWYEGGQPMPMGGHCPSPNNLTQSNGWLRIFVWAESAPECNGQPQAHSGGLISTNPRNGVPGHQGFEYRYGFVEWRVSFQGTQSAGCPTEGCLVQWPGVWSYNEQGATEELDVAEGLPGGQNAPENSLKGLPCYTLHAWQDPRFGPGKAPAWTGCSPQVGGWVHNGFTFHTFALDWEPNGLSFYYDGVEQPFRRYQEWFQEPPGSTHLNSRDLTFDPKHQDSIPTQREFLVAHFLPSGGRTPEVFPAEMKIDWVRVYQHPHPPTLSGMSYDNVGETSVTLHGVANPEGLDYGGVVSKRYDAQAYFECGPAGSAYPILPPHRYLGMGSGNSNVSETITGLAPDTNYHCRLSADNGAIGVAHTPDVNFKTLPPPPPPPPVAVTQPPAEATSSKITMAGKFDGLGKAGSYYFEYGNLAGYGWKTAEQSFPAEPAGFHPVTASLEELPVGWTIHYRLVVNTSNGTGIGQDQVGTTAWANELSTAPGEAKSDWLNDVSCPSAGNCLAVGGRVDQKTGATRMTGQRWTGSAWTPTAVSQPGGENVELKGVSCTAPTSCMAAGFAQSASGYRPVAMQWNGTIWAETASPAVSPAAFSAFNDVACTAANSCEAVGYTGPSGSAHGIKPLIEHWNGSTWAVRTAANPATPGGEPSQEDNKLESVSCASASICKAVGSHYSSVGGVQAYQPLIENLSGEQWVSEEADTYYLQTEGETDIRLFGVSCPTTAWCVAVGSSAAGHAANTPQRPFTQRWTGGSWLNVGAPKEASEASQLTGVSCTSPGACRAVSANSRGLHWTGTYWKIEGPLAPADNGSQPPRPSGISCPTPQECQSVGSYTNASGYLGRLTQGWSGAGVAPRTGLAFAANVAESTATLRGAVDPGGVDTHYYFEYGPTEAYGSKTPEFSAGSWAVGLASGWFDASAPVTGLKPGTKYHYRVVATNGSASSNGPDYTFETLNGLAEMPVTEAFNGGTTPVSDFATKWAPLGWVGGATRKGTNFASGYGSADGSLVGAYFLPPVADGGSGVATQATMATAPPAGGRFSLWLDLSNPATAKTGYELRLLATSTNVFTVSLKKVAAGAETNLGTVSAQSIPNGSSLTLIDKGGTVSAWVNTGSGFVNILEAADSSYSGGNAGVEILNAVNVRLTKFKVGKPTPKATSFEAAAKGIEVTDAFARNESPLSLSGSWGALAWDTATIKTGEVFNGLGWGVNTGTVSGAFWQKAMVGDTGSGDAVIATNNFSSMIGYFALWLNAPSPGTVKSGYQLRIAPAGGTMLEAKLTKWVNGVATTLATKSNLIYPNLNGLSFALSDEGGTVSAWIGLHEVFFSPALTAADSTYSYGYGGVEASGGVHVVNFKRGPLAPR